MRKKGRVIWIILLVISVAAFGVFAYWAGSNLLEYKQSNDEYDELRQIKAADTQPAGAPSEAPDVLPTAALPTATAQREAEPLFMFVSEDEAPDDVITIDAIDAPTAALATPQAQMASVIDMSNVSAAPVSIDFTSLGEINPDIVGWVTLGDTNIDYPIAQGLDDEYYLNHSFRRTYNKSGCVFLGTLYKPDFTEENSVIYGHHMKDGSMFHNLTKYNEQEYFEEHQTGTLYTPQGEYDLTVFSAYVVYSDGRFQRSGFADEADTNAFFDEIVQRSTIESTLVPRWPQQVLTLVTCSYDYSDARYVVHALMEPKFDAENILGVM